MLLVPYIKFGDKMVIELGTRVIDTALQVITKEELSNASNL